MWYPQKLLVKNLMSHSLSGYEFKTGKAVMINGINNYDEGQESNGSGKSAILEGIAICLLGAPLRDASVKELIKRGEDDCNCELVLWNSKTQQTMTIKRKFFSNSKSAELEVLINDKPITDITSVRHGNEMILETIGIARDDLLNYYLLSNEKYVPFLKMSDVKKKEMIGRFSQSDLINPTIEALDNDLSEQLSKVTEISSKKEKIDAKIEVYTDEIDSLDLVEAQNRRDIKIANLKNEIQVLEESLSKLADEKNIIKAKQELIITNANSYQKKDFQLAKEKVDKIEKIYLKEQSILKTELEGMNKLLSRIDKSLLNAVECPKCQHEFSVVDKKINIEKARSRRDDVNLEIINISKDMSTVKISLERNDAKRDEIKVLELKQRDEIKALMQAVEDVKDDLETKDRSIKRLSENIIEKKDILKELSTTPIIDGADAYQKEINLLNKELDVLKEDEYSYEKKIKELSEIKSTLIKFKTHLSNKAIGAIEAQANHYLENTKTSLSVQLDGYKVNKDGKIKENISATIYRDNLEEGVLGTFSGGEKARIIISLIISPQKLINMNCISGGLDLLFLDEVIESADSVGIKGIMSSLNMTGQTVLVVTHGTFNQSYPYMVDVVKQSDGVSIIKQ